MLRKNDTLIFHNSDHIEKHNETMRLPNIQWGNRAMNFKADYRKGWLLTDKRNRVDAYKIKPETVQRTIVESGTGKPVKPQPEDLLAQCPLEPAYNCFGFCFAESTYFITNPTVIIEDEYEEVSIGNAQIIVHISHNGYDEQGRDIWQYSHGMILNPNGTVSFKPGFRPLITEINFDQRTSIYNFNHEIYLRKRT